LTIENEDEKEQIPEVSIEELIESTKTVVAKGKKANIIWYNLFDEWFEKTYFDWDPLHGKIPLVRWDALIKEWFIYDEKKGFYRKVLDEKVDYILVHWADLVNYELKSSAFNLQIKRLKTLLYFDHKKWNHKNELINIKNGVLNLETKKIEDHSPHFLFNQQFNARFLPNFDKNGIPQPKPTKYIDKIRNVYPNQFLILERFIQAMIYYDLGNELMIFMYGATGSGKGTILNLVETIFKDCKVNGSLHTLGEGFGLTLITVARVMFDKDMSIAALNAHTVAMVKKITGLDTQDGTTINIKHVKQFQEAIKCFFISATNQFPKLPANTDRLAWFRRCLILIFDIIQESDSDFKNNVLKDLDNWFTELILMNYIPIVAKGFDKKKWAEKQADIWDYSANPFKRYVLEMFEKTNDGSDEIEQEEVCDYIRDRLNDDSYNMPGEKSLKQNITTELSTLRIRKKTQKYITRYFWIKLRPEWRMYVNGDETLEEVMKKHKDRFEQIKVLAKMRKRKKPKTKKPKNAQQKINIPAAPIKNNPTDNNSLSENKINEIILLQIKKCRGPEPQDGLTFLDIYEPIANIEGVSEKMIKKSLLDLINNKILKFETEAGEYKLITKKIHQVKKNEDGFFDKSGKLVEF